MPRNSIRESNVYLYNPLPGGLSESDVWEKADMYNRRAREDVPAFRVNYIYAQGDPNQEERFVLDPGEFLDNIPAGEGQTITKTLRDQGIVVVLDPDDLDEVRKASIEGLTAAITHYNERGAKQIVNYQRTHGFSEEEMKIQRARIDFYFINAEKEKLVEAHLKKVRANRKVKGKTKEE